MRIHILMSCARTGSLRFRTARLADVVAAESSCRGVPEAAWAAAFPFPFVDMAAVVDPQALCGASRRCPNRRGARSNAAERRTVWSLCCGSSLLPACFSPAAVVFVSCQAGGREGRNTIGKGLQRLADAQQQQRRMARGSAARRDAGAAAAAAYSLLPSRRLRPCP